MPIIKPVRGTLLDIGDPINRGCVARWLFNENGGNLVNDISGNKRNGTITGATWAAGQFGPCLSLDGTDAVATASNFIALNGAATWSCSAWVLVPGAPAADHYFIMLDATSANTICYFRFRTNNILYFYSRASEVTNFCGSAAGAISDGRWHYVAGVYDGTYVRLYIDGMAVGTPGALTGVAEPLTTPARIIPTGFVGYMDVPSIYNRALTPAEIARLYREPNAGLQVDRLPLIIGAMGGGGAITNVTVEPSALEVMLGIHSPATQYDFLHSVSALTAQLAIQSPGVDLDYLHTVSSLALYVALQTPAEHFDFKQAVATLAAQLELHSPAVSFGQTAVVSALSLLTASPAPVTNYDFVYSPAALSALLATHSPTMAYDYTIALGAALSLAAALQAPDISTGVNVTVEPGTQQLVLSLAHPVINFDYVHAIAATLGLTCTVLAPVVSGEVGRTYIVCSSTNPAQLDFYIGGVLVARFT